MIQLSNPAMLQHEAESSELGGGGKPGPVVKVEVEDTTEDEYGPLNKRSRSSDPFPQDQERKFDSDAPSVSSQLVKCNLLNEPSPLGLRLRKSPSLLELIQMKLAQSSAEPCQPGSVSGSASEAGKKKDPKAAGNADKMKASNFPASLLRIGNWECVSRYEGDLVAKCYFAKHKLVWEVLDGGLKSKIEIQWSDITALKASCPDNGPGSLDIVLGRQPLFYRETNPQPRKHTLWQATSDFTGGQASIHRRHFLQCPPGLLSKHFEKLIQCDPRLNSLSRQQEIILESPFFEPRCSVFESQEDDKACGFNHVKTDLGPSFSGFHDTSPSCSFLSTSSKSDLKDAVGRTPESSSMESPSPISGLDRQITEENTSFESEKLKDPSGWDQLKVPGLHPSMSMTDLVNHIGNCISEKASGNQAFSGNSVMNKEMLDEITQYLLGDSQLASASDEGSLMSRVNSLCCLLQNPMPAENRRTKDVVASSGNDSVNERELAESKRPVLEFPTFEVDGNDSKQPPTMSRKESFGDLLLHLPRIASLPQFLFNISEDGEGDSR